MGTDGGRNGADCCVTVLLGFVALVALLAGGFWWWAVDTENDNEAQARAQMKGAAEAVRERLAASAADGTLLGTEIARGLGKPMPGGDVRRQGRTVTVTARFHGAAPGWMVGGTTADGCYRFRADPPDVSARELPYEDCLKLPHVGYRAPEEVAPDVVAELRATVARDGLDAAGDAEVWRTGGVRLQDQENAEGRLTALVRLEGETSAVWYCYAFRVRVAPVSVTYEKLTRQDCLRGT
ncbi:hypothetical protein ACFYWX_00095 [Streptomyces sp. NPDC002888]|uniref:hypothetical protein n=1 Tax=Streptomyces sp. NPDC002888 TaxID=3364668 RepID=UPI0036CE434C